MTSDEAVRILHGDCIEQLQALPAGSVQSCITSPPYFGLRSYLPESDPLKAREVGLEATPDAFVEKLVSVFREVRRVLRDDGTLFLNLGDSWASQGGAEPPQTKWKREGIHDGQNGGKSRRPPPGLKAKDLIGIPWMVAFALRADGWWLRQEIIWHRPNAMPESSARDRCTKSHEHVFLLSKSARYHFDHEAIKEATADGAGLRARRSVWSIPTRPGKSGHIAVFPPDLVEPCVLAGSRPGDVVLDPFGGSGTTARVALKHGRRAVLCELNAEYLPLIRESVSAAAPATADLFDFAAAT